MSRRLYEVVLENGVAVREEPYNSSLRVFGLGFDCGARVKCKARMYQRFHNGVEGHWLQLADGSGWLFDTVPTTGAPVLAVTSSSVHSFLRSCEREWCCTARTDFHSYIFCSFIRSFWDEKRCRRRMRPTQYKVHSGIYTVANLLSQTFFI